MDRSTILEHVRTFFDTAHARKKFEPGKSYIPPTGKVLDADDCEHLVDASLDMWLTTGRYGEQFEKSLASYCERKLAKLTVSGSAANLLAFSTLMSPKLAEDKLSPGDEVITVAAGFPTTVAPIVQNGCIPVFVDIDLDTHNVDVDLIEAAITSRTRAVMIAHSLGNPFNVSRVRDICRANNLYLIEDCCDALGAKFDDNPVGTFGELATLSFYPAHHITMGEGGAVLMNSMKLGRICESYRDWGRDCYCKTGCDNTCGKRFDWQLGDLPYGYDHKYTYSHLGYNLKVSDMQAALGVSQLKKADKFIDRRRYNFNKLNDKIIEAGLQEFVHLPKATPGAQPSWFGYLITLKDDYPTKRNVIVENLEQRNVGTRLLFAGNIIKQPAFKDVKYKVAGNLVQTNKVMNDSFWIGVWPGIDDEMIDYMVTTLSSVLKGDLICKP